MGARSAPVLIVGCGRIAGGFNDMDEHAVLSHALAYQRLGAELVACCDRDAQKGESFAQRWGIRAAGTDLKELLQQTRPTLVSVCTPADQSRLATLRTILSAPTVRAVLMEKPLARDSRDAYAMLALAEQSGRQVLVSYFRAFDPFYRELTAASNAQAMGHLCEAAVRYYGAAVDNASHMLERVLEMFGEPESVQRLGGDDISPTFGLRFASGGRALFSPTQGCDYAPLELDLLFQRGRIRVVDSERRAEVFAAAPDPLFSGYRTLLASAWPMLGAPSHEAILHVVRAAIKATREDGVDYMLLRRAVRVTEILEQIGAT